MKLIVGEYRDGSKRFEVRHVNDLRFAHPESLAAPAQRPKLGRPRTSSLNDAKSSTDNVNSDYVSGGSGTSNRFHALGSKQNQNDATAESANHETSILADQPPASAAGDGLSIKTTGPPPAPAFDEAKNLKSRSVRSTRNPNPKYVDAVWVASPSQLQEINRSINGHSSSVLPA